MATSVGETLPETTVSALQKLFTFLLEHGVSAPETREKLLETLGNSALLALWFSDETKELMEILVRKILYISDRQRKDLLENIKEAFAQLQEAGEEREDDSFSEAVRTVKDNIKEDPAFAERCELPKDLVGSEELPDLVQRVIEAVFPGMFKTLTLGGKVNMERAIKDELRRLGFEA